MTKSILISVRPKNLVNILNGNKTLELRKSFPKDFIGWVYVYVTKSKPYLGKNIDGHYGLYNMPYFGHFNKVGDLNGKVVARFWFDGYWVIYPYEDNTYVLYPGFLSSLQLTLQDVNDYGKGKTLYAWHIEKLEIFDEPLKLRDFALVSNYKHVVEELAPYKKGILIFGNTLKRAPQSWCYVYTNKGEKMTSKEALELLASRVQLGAYKEEMQKCFDIVNKAIEKAQKQEKLLERLYNVCKEYKHMSIGLSDDSDFINIMNDIEELE